MNREYYPATTSPGRTTIRFTKEELIEALCVKANINSNNSELFIWGLEQRNLSYRDCDLENQDVITLVIDH